MRATPRRDAVKAACRGAAAGLAGPAAFLWLLARGLTPPWAAACCAAAALAPAACGIPVAGPASLLGVGAGLAASTLLLVPTAGIYAAFAAALVLLALSRGLVSTPTRGDAAAAAAASGAALAAWRCLSFLIGHSLYAAVFVGFGAAVGMAAGRALRRLAGGKKVELPGLGPISAALLFLLTLELLRMLGLNASQPEHVRSAVSGAGELLWFGCHAAAGVALACAALAGLELDAPAGSPLAPLTPLAAAALLPVLGPAATLGAAASALAGLGAWRGRSRWLRDPILSRAVPVALVVVVALTLHARRALFDVAINRLIHVYPGGNVLVWREQAGQTLAVYRFGSGVPILLRDGVADLEGGEAAFVPVRQLLAVSQGGSLLLAGALHPESLAAAAALGRAPNTTLYARARGCRDIVAALTPGGQPALPNEVDCGGRAPKGPFDAIAVVVPPPLSEPENALAATRQRAQYWRRRLTDGGTVLWQIPAPPDSAGARGAAAAVRAAFARVAETPLGAGTLLIAGDKLEPQALMAGQNVQWSVFEDTAAAPAVDWKPLAALPARP